MLLDWADLKLRNSREFCVSTNDITMMLELNATLKWIVLG